MIMKQCLSKKCQNIFLVNVGMLVFDIKQILRNNNFYIFANDNDWYNT